MYNDEIMGLLRDNYNGMFNNGRARLTNHPKGMTVKLISDLIDSLLELDQLATVHRS